MLIFVVYINLCKCIFFNKKEYFIPCSLNIYEIDHIMALYSLIHCI